MSQRINTHGIGASEISAIVGMNPYASPWDMWRRKVGLVPDIEPSEAIEWGHRLEPPIRQKYVDTTGAVVYVPPESLYSTETTWARATPDGIVLVGPEDRPHWDRIVQCKNVGYWAGKDWDGAPPVYVQIQEQWELYVTKLDRADVAPLIAGSDFRIYTVHRDDKLIADLVTIAEAFWRRVESRTPPPADESTACRDHFASRLARAGVVELIADVELEAEVAAWHAARTTFKTAEADVEKRRNAVLQALAGAGADRIVSTHGVAKLARISAKTTSYTNWRLVAEMLATATGSAEMFSTLVAANTATTTSEASVTLREPQGWSKEKA